MLSAVGTHSLLHISPGLNTRAAEDMPALRDHRFIRLIQTDRTERVLLYKTEWVIIADQSDWDDTQSRTRCVVKIVARVYPVEGYRVNGFVVVVNVLL